ncbi:hypothetical protein CAPTEDRAFT_209266 [Capitella teleta]|uniref:Uncharacterized protein n=1 Tax=Capitella teleta TaxID=283909 RepID=R7UEE4_CAPTE|nr:hypothetical protein CAPTEDRAFT_209266 [Capitella teleta]|eukprot:ELU02163.1 hypothetical protein CAPTEDRAFT_209266 [Capitella teleta]
MNTVSWITHLLVLLWILLCLPLDVYGYNNVEECEDYRGRQVVYVSDTNSLLELHIRHNLQGHVEIRDARSSEKEIRIEVEKSASSSSSIEGIVVNSTVYDVNAETFYVLQLSRQYIYKYGHGGVGCSI